MREDCCFSSFQVVFDISHSLKVLHWDFTPARVEGGVVEDSSGIGVSASGTANDGLLSASGVDLVQASPSLNPGYPCGVVHTGIWRFAGSEDFVLGLRNSTSYGGRLQFRCVSSLFICHNNDNLKQTAAKGYMGTTSRVRLPPRRTGNSYLWERLNLSREPCTCTIAQL